MDMRNDMRGMNAMGDGRNPYGSQGGYVVNARGGGRGGRGRGRGRMNRGGRGGDRGMTYPMYDMNGNIPYNMVYNMPYDMRRGDMANYSGDMRMDMNYNSAYMNNEQFRANRGNDMAGGGMDGHHMGTKQGGSTYYPIQAMGTFEGYYGMPNQDHARGDRGDYRGGDMAGYDMRGGMTRNDYGYPMYPNYMHYPPYDFGYPMGDFGETLSVEELEKWNKKLLKKVEEKYRPFFTKENVMQRAKQKGYEMKDFGENELLTATLMQYTDLCHYLKPFVGENLDAYIGAGYGFLVDDDAGVKGAEKLAVYYDNVVEAGEDD